MTDKRVRITRDFIDPDPWTDGDSKRPVLAIVREVEILTAGSRVAVEFSRSSKLLDVSTKQEREKLFIEVGKGAYQFPNAGNAKPPKGEPPLSVNNQFLCYLIYVLKNKNVQFSHDDGPITIESAAQSSIFEASHIDNTGKLKLAPKPGCRAAYIIADADRAYDANHEYHLRINLHVDLITEDANDDPTVFMPIIIDPDIRHPGGANP